LSWHSSCSNHITNSGFLGEYIINIRTPQIFKLALAGIALGLVTAQPAFAAESLTDVKYRTVTIDGQDIFYREASDPNDPTIVLLHNISNAFLVIKGSPQSHQNSH
jgi:hypothetical protein